MPVDHRLIRRDRQTKYCVFLKILTNFPFQFCFAALPFLPNGIGGVFVNYGGHTVIRNTVNLYSQCFLALLFFNNHISIFYKVADVYKSIKL